MTIHAKKQHFIYRFTICISISVNIVLKLQNFYIQKSISFTHAPSYPIKVSCVEPMHLK